MQPMPRRVRALVAVMTAIIFCSFSGASVSATRPHTPTTWKSASAGGKSFAPRIRSRGSVNVRALASHPNASPRKNRSLPFLAPARSSSGSPSSSGPRVVGPPPPVQATITTNAPAAQPGFEGLAEASGPSTAAEPPDPWVGVGPDHVAQVVNTSLRITDRAGGGATDVALADFFGISGLPFPIFNSDPRIIYDSLHGRWIATEVEWDCQSDPPGGAVNGHGYIDIAVSTGSDPTGTWSLVPFQFNDALPDYPAPGTSSDKVAFAANLFSLTPSTDCTTGTAPLGIDILVLDWAKLLNPTTLPFDEYGSSDTSYFTPRPAVQYPATSAPLQIVVQKMVSGHADVDYVTITGLVGAGGGTTATEVNLTAGNVIQEFVDPLAPQQPSGDVTTAIDSRPTDAIWQNNRLTFVSTQACTPTGDTTPRDCVRVSQLNTSTATPSLAQDFLVAAIGEDSYYGGIGVSGNSGLFVVWTQSSGTSGDYPSSYGAYQLRTDAANSISPAELLAQGQANHTGGRWGDYVGVAQDPQDPNAAWQGNEYVPNDTTWGTFISQFKTGAGSTYVPMSPSRVLDTRINLGLSGKFTSGTARTFVVAGHGGVPSNAVAVTGNLTVTQQTGLGYVSLTVAPTNSPPTSTINFPVGDNRANNATIPLSATGTLSAVYKSSAGKTTQLIFDMTGYFLDDNSGATYTPVTPARVLDSRAASQIGPYGTPFQANVSREFPIWLKGGIPGTATAVTGNLTVTGQTSAGYMTLSNQSTNNPSTSTLNFPLGDNRANGVSVALTASGSLWAVYKAPSGHANVLFDVTGYYEPGTGGLRFFPLNPGRRLDGRPGANVGLPGVFHANLSRALEVDGHLGVPAGAAAITGNLTVTSQTKLGYASITPDPNNNPATSTINFPVGDNRANGVTMPLSTVTPGNTSLVYRAVSTGTTYLLLDITGYFK
jgi:hypothetical protein